VPNDVTAAETRASATGCAAAGLLIERERELLKIREDAARGVDVQATAITAATLAIVAVAAGADALSDANDGWLIAAGVLLVLSAVAGGIARLPAFPPLKALSRAERDRIFELYANKPQPTMRRLGRDLGGAIRESERTLRGLSLESPPGVVQAEVLDHWRARNNLARYRMHSKSAWFSLSLVLLYFALLLATAAVLFGE
jgi:hypothetical protein